MSDRVLFTDESAVMQRELPSPAKGRWQPLRSGLLNLYRFDYEEFWFEDGHLLLKGNNGTGKSRVLALQLPFLLDGDTSSERVEPDADPAKKMEWNLLLGVHPERTGYTWLEFGRRTATGAAAGEDQFLTIGCGLSAVAGRGTVNRWYFVTSQRVGRELFLQAKSGQALSRERLVEEIGARGRVFTTAVEYRQAIDQALFKLGAQRYDALVDLLIKLRQPKLSRNLDAQVLSKALSEALPPLSPNILADVAESFRTLESDRAMLETFTAAQRGVEQFLTDYARYVKIAARRRADDVRKAQAAYEQALRNLRRAETERDAADADVRALTARLEALAIDEQRAEATVQALQNSPQMADAKALERAKHTVNEREYEAGTAKDELRHAERLRDESEQRLRAERERTARTRTELEGQTHRALECATHAALETDHRKAVHAAGLPEPADLQALPDARRRLDEALSKRAQAIAHLRNLNRKVDSDHQALNLAKQLQDNIASQLDEALERQRQAYATRDQAAIDLFDGYRAWAKNVTELAPADADTLDEAFQAWAESGSGQSPVTAAVHAAELDATRRFAALKEQCDQRLSAADAELTELRNVYDSLQAGRHEPPPPPHTRDPNSRRTRPGAPLWLLCDFAPQVEESARSGLEAALEAAGLLDAWVTPDGRLLASGEQDTVIVAGTSPLAPEGQRLDQMLIPAIDRAAAQTAGMRDETVQAVLQHIGASAGAGQVWVDASGCWQVGPLHGAYSKPNAEHIGHGAREARRRQRLAELAVAIDTAEQSLAGLQRDKAAVVERERTMRGEVATAPRDDELRQSLAALATASQEVGRQREQLVEADHSVAEQTRVWQQSSEQRTRDATDLGIAAWIERLDELHEALQAYRYAISELWSKMELHLVAREVLTRAVAHAQEAADEAALRAARWQETLGKAQSAAENYRVLQESIGAAVEEILQRLDEAKQRYNEVRRARGSCTDQRSEQQTQLAVAQRDVDNFTATRDQDAVGRDTAVSQLKAFAATRLLPLAARGIAEDDLAAGASTTRVVDAARVLETELTDVAFDEPAWERSQNAIYKRTEELKTSLSAQGYQPEAGTEAGVFVVSMPFLGRTLTMLALQEALTDEVNSRKLLLNAKEREILENHLIGEVALHLHELLHNAEALVQRMNDELRKRPTSAGMQLRFVWRPADDAPPGMADARKRLLRADGTWSPAEREALGSFLQQRIQEVRAANAVGTWQDHLAEALDYRGWHFFDVERNQDSQWKRLTKRTHGTGSGGEKAIALTIPQFAAAAAHYATADHSAPRLILLDEAFVGVDADMRRKCMGLLEAFDLDFVMTSEREWGCYDTLPGLAIYHLSSRAGIDAVHVTRWVWNGRERRQSQPLLPSATRPDPDSTSPGGNNGDPESS